MIIHQWVITSLLSAQKSEFIILVKITKTNNNTLIELAAIGSCVNDCILSIPDYV